MDEPTRGNEMPIPDATSPGRGQNLRLAVTLALLVLCLGSCAGTVPEQPPGQAEETMERPPVRPAGKGERRQLVGVPFAPNRWTLSPRARAVLAQIGANGTEGGDAYFEIHGFCDARSSGHRGTVLAQKRAEAVRDYLHREGGISLDHIGARATSTCAPPPSSSVPGAASSPGHEVTGAVVIVLASSRG